MKIIIEAKPKEIADLVVQIQGQPQATLENYIPTDKAEKVDHFLNGITVNLD